MTFPETSLELARRLLGACERRGWHLATAESCTGGLIIACLTEIPGSSSVVERGYVTYDNRAKAEVLGVPAALFERVGAVSEEVARAMAEGARDRAGVDLTVAVTGIAGPGGATPTKPVGLVHMAVARTARRPCMPVRCFRAIAPRSALPASMPRSVSRCGRLPERSRTPAASSRQRRAWLDPRTLAPSMRAGAMDPVREFLARGLAYARISSPGTPLRPAERCGR